MRFIMNGIVAGVVMAGVFVGGCSSSGGASPSAVVAKFVSAVQEKDFDEAVTYMVPEISEDDEARAKVSSMIASGAAKNGEMSGFQITDETIADSTAEVTVSLTFKNGTTNKESVNLKQIDGKWYVAMQMQ